MRVLMVEDNALNAFCLGRLLRMVYQQIEVTIAENSAIAASLFEKDLFDLIILDGDLGSTDNSGDSGPGLAEAFWLAKPELSIIAWTDSASFRQSFSEVFSQYNKPFNENTCWTKLVSQDHIRQSLAPLIED